jgi:hypothetical protein
MLQAQYLYNANRFIIDALLSQYGYPQTFEGMMQAVKEKNNAFLVPLYNDITSHYDQADGKGWAKFKNIFNKTTEVIGKVGKGANIANSFLNPPDDTDPLPDPTPKKEPWKPNIYFWGGAGLLIIVILVIIYLFKSNS